MYSSQSLLILVQSECDNILLNIFLISAVKVSMFLNEYLLFKLDLALFSFAIIP